MPSTGAPRSSEGLLTDSQAAHLTLGSPAPPAAGREGEGARAARPAASLMASGIAFQSQQQEAFPETDDIFPKSTAKNYLLPSLPILDATEKL